MSSRPCCRAFGTVRPLHPVSCTRVCARTPLPHSREDASAAWTLCQPSRSGAHRGCAFGSLCPTWRPAGRRDMHTRVCARQARPVPPEKLPREGVWQMLSQRGRRSDGQAWAAHTFRGAGRGQGRGHVGRRSEQSSTRGSSSSAGAAAHTNAAVPGVCLGTQRAALLGCHGGERLATGMVLRPWRAPSRGQATSRRGHRAERPLPPRHALPWLWALGSPAQGLLSWVPQGPHRVAG